MDNQRPLLLNWSCLYQEKSMDELKQNLLLAMELEETRLKAQEELKMRDEQIAQLKELLNTAIKERDEAQEKCQKMFLEKIFLQQQLQKWQQSTPHSGISSIEDDPKRGMESNNGGFSSSDCDESVVSPPPPPVAAAEEPELLIEINRALPERGKFLQAVMKAGPLLQTLLLAGPLPQWRHPPPPLDSYQIPPPPVVIPPPPPPPPLPTRAIFQDSLQSINNCGRINRKRSGLSEGSDSSNELKYQRVVLQ